MNENRLSKAVEIGDVVSVFNEHELKALIEQVRLQLGIDETELHSLQELLKKWIRKRGKN